MKIGLTIKAIIRWEQLLKKSFSLMNYANKEDINALLYTTTICNNEGKMYTFDVFQHTLSNEKIVSEMIMVLERETAMLNQFQKKQEAADSGSPDFSPGLIGDLVSTLILSGLDAHYVLNEMELCDLPLFIEAYENKRKEQMESDRLWTYLNILPHVDGKKLPSAREMYPFPWEQKAMEEAAAKSIQEDADKLEAFFEQGNNLIRQNYGG